MGLNELIKIGNTFKEYRKQSSLTQSEMADALNIPRSTYASYENNTREPSEEILEKIASYFHVPIDYLLVGALTYQNHGIKYPSILKTLSKQNIDNLISDYPKSTQNAVYGLLTNYIFNVFSVPKKTLNDSDDSERMTFEGLSYLYLTTKMANIILEFYVNLKKIFLFAYTHDFTDDKMDCYEKGLDEPLSIPAEMLTPFDAISKSMLEDLNKLKSKTSINIDSVINQFEELILNFDSSDFKSKFQDEILEYTKQITNINNISESINKVNKTNFKNFIENLNN